MILSDEELEEAKNRYNGEGHESDLELIEDLIETIDSLKKELKISQEGRFKLAEEIDSLKNEIEFLEHYESTVGKCCVDVWELKKQNAKLKEELAKIKEFDRTPMTIKSHFTADYKGEQ